jgi:putative ABC transport system substrate-binding protein
LFVPSEVNTVFHKDMLVKAANAVGIEVVAVPVTSSSEINDAAMALCSRRIDALCQVGGNLLGSSFTSIARAARQAKLPVFAFLSTQSRQGAAVVVARDYYDGGREAGHLAARVLRGEDPSTLPFQPLQATKTIVNLKAARETGLTIPQSMIERADEVVRD